MYELKLIVEVRYLNPLAVLFKTGRIKKKKTKIKNADEMFYYLLLLGGLLLLLPSFTKKTPDQKDNNKIVCNQ